MQLEARTTQRLEQRMLPQMLQSIEVLQLATADLLQLVSQQLESNEVLELEPAQDAATLAAEVVDATAAVTAEWEADGVRRTNEDVDGRRAMLENQPAPTDGLLESVQLQVAFRELAPDLAAAVTELAGRLDQRGLLPEALDQVAADTGLAAELLRRALDELQSMEPRGLGASTGVEAMLLQAQGDPDFAAIEVLLTEHLEALSRNKLPDVARAMHLDLQELQDLIERMRDLTPAPAAGLHAAAEPGITADVAAWLEDGEVRVELAEHGVPQLAVNEFYARLARDRGTDRVLRDHLRGRLRAANDLIFAIEQRQSTLLRTATALFRHQRDFLEQGRLGLRPLRMADLAAQLGVHASTISRAIAGKYVVTAFGTFALREFCEGGSADGTAEAGHARTAVAQHVADLVQAEDRQKPLSDDALVARLQELGIRVARRTVTKLRQELGIPSSYRRRQHGGKQGR
ncbi:MAG: RNA polymerase factor sigma-54 [Planctomycetota bacterium]